MRKQIGRWTKVWMTVLTLLLVTAIPAFAQPPVGNSTISYPQKINGGIRVIGGTTTTANANVIFTVKVQLRTGVNRVLGEKTQTFAGNVANKQVTLQTQCFTGSVWGVVTVSRSDGNTGENRVGPSAAPCG